MPDALYRTAFQLFDTNGNGTVSFGMEDMKCILYGAYWRNISSIAFFYNSHMFAHFCTF